MRSHKIKVVIPEDHQITVRLPSDFPEGRAELIVISEPSTEGVISQSGAEAAEDFERWLKALLEQVPRVPTLPPEAFDREHIYDD